MDTTKMDNILKETTFNFEEIVTSGYDCYFMYFISKLVLRGISSYEQYGSIDNDVLEDCFCFINDIYDSVGVSLAAQIEKKD